MTLDTRTLTISEIADGIKAGRFSAVDVTKAVLDTERAQRGRTASYLRVDEEGALAAAAASDARYASGQALSPLDGVPVGVKDLILAAGQKATAASRILSAYTAAYDATAVRRLRDAGAVLIGKTNLDEFAMGSSTESSAFGPTKNPWDASRVPGGSSGGSAAAVAEGSAVVALGTDTGGSIRQPAALCGTVGLKPTYGRVSRYGVIAMASSLDQVGPFAHTVDDAAAVLRVIEGRDPKDASTVQLTESMQLPERITGDVAGKRIGIPKEFFASGIDAGVEEAVRATLAALEKKGAVLKEISLPHAGQALAVYYVLMPSEVSANLARYDGIRYGERKGGATLEDTYRATRGAGFGPEVRRRIMLGTYALSAGYYDAYYLKAQKVRRLIANDYAAAFTEVDVIVTPTSPSVAWRIGEKVADPLSMYLMDVFTVSANVAGLPGVSVPCGMDQGLPVGIQFMGPQFADAEVLNAAKAVEKEIAWLANGNVPPAT